MGSCYSGEASSSLDQCSADQQLMQPLTSGETVAPPYGLRKPYSSVRAAGTTAGTTGGARNSNELWTAGSNTALATVAVKPTSRFGHFGFRATDSNSNVAAVAPSRGGLTKRSTSFQPVGAAEEWPMIDDESGGGGSCPSLRGPASGGSSGSVDKRSLSNASSVTSQRDSENNATAKLSGGLNGFIGRRNVKNKAVPDVPMMQRLRRPAAAAAAAPATGGGQGRAAALISRMRQPLPRFTSALLSGRLPGRPGKVTDGGKPPDPATPKPDAGKQAASKPDVSQYGCVQASPRLDTGRQDGGPAGCKEGGAAARPAVALRRHPVARPVSGVSVQMGTSQTAGRTPTKPGGAAVCADGDTASGQRSPCVKTQYRVSCPPQIATYCIAAAPGALAASEANGGKTSGQSRADNDSQLALLLPKGQACAASQLSQPDSSVAPRPAGRPRTLQRPAPVAEVVRLAGSTRAFGSTGVLTAGQDRVEATGSHKLPGASAAKPPASRQTQGRAQVPSEPRPAQVPAADCETVTPGVATELASSQVRNMEPVTVATTRAASRDDDVPVKRDVSQSQTKVVSQYQTKDLSQSKTKAQTKHRGQSQTKDLNQSQSKDLNQSQTKDLSRSQTKELCPSQSKDLSRSQTKELCPSQSKDLGPSQTKDLCQSQTKELCPSQTKDLSPSQTKDLGPSQNKDLSRSRSTCGSATPPPDASHLPASHGDVKHDGAFAMRDRTSGNSSEDAGYFELDDAATLVNTPVSSAAGETPPAGRAPIAMIDSLETTSIGSCDSDDSDDLMLETDVCLDDYPDVTPDREATAGGGGGGAGDGRRDSGKRRARCSLTLGERPSREESRRQRQSDTAEPLEELASLISNNSLVLRREKNGDRGARPSSLPTGGALCKDAQLSRQHSTLLKPPRQSSSIEDDDDVKVNMDGFTHRHLMQDLTSVKTMLFRLKRVIQDEELGSPFDHPWKPAQLGGGDVAGSDVLPASLSDVGAVKPDVSVVMQDNVDLRQQIHSLKQQQQHQLEERDKTIKLLQQQMTKYECGHLGANGKVFTHTACQTELPKTNSIPIPKIGRLAKKQTLSSFRPATPTTGEDSDSAKVSSKLRRKGGKAW